MGPILEMKDHEFAITDFTPPKVRQLGVVDTIGGLKKLIENYPDDTSFGFRNQPMQELHEVDHGDVLFIVFQETD